MTNTAGRGAIATVALRAAIVNGTVRCSGTTAVRPASRNLVSRGNMRQVDLSATLTTTTAVELACPGVSTNVPTAHTSVVPDSLVAGRPVNTSAPAEGCTRVSTADKAPVSTSEPCIVAMLAFSIGVVPF